MGLTMGITDIVKGDDGYHSMGRWLTILTATTLTYGFVKETLGSNHLDWKLFIAYSLSMIMTYSTSKAVEIIQAIKGIDPNKIDPNKIDRISEEIKKL